MKRGQRWRDRRAREADDARADEVSDAAEHDAEHDARSGRARVLQGSPTSGRRARAASTPAGAGRSRPARRTSAAPRCPGPRPGRRLGLAVHRHRGRRLADAAVASRVLRGGGVPGGDRAAHRRAGRAAGVAARAARRPRRLAALLVVIGGLASSRCCSPSSASRSPPASTTRRPGRPTASSEIQDWLRDRAAARQRLADQRLDRADPGRDHRRQGKDAVAQPRHRGRHRARPHRRRLLHRAVLDVLLPRRRPPDLGLGGPALPARRPRARRLLRPGRLGLADPVRAGHRDRRAAPTRSAS